MISAQTPSRSAASRSAPVARGVTASVSFRVTSDQVIISATPIISPGTMPPMNSLAIEMLPATPSTISGSDGGMTGAMIPPAASSPSERPSG